MFERRKFVVSDVVSSANSVIDERERKNPGDQEQRLFRSQGTPAKICDSRA